MDVGSEVSDDLTLNIKEPKRQAILHLCRCLLDAAKSSVKLHSNGKEEPRWGVTE